MNGYEFVEKVLGQTNYDVEPLIEISEGIETEWLEFKAATAPSDGNFENNTNKWDYRWHVSKALFAMANSIGGAVIVGIGENKNINSKVEHVSLALSGFHGDKDKFIMEFESQILFPQDGWSTIKEGKIKCLEYHNLFRPIWGTFEEKPVLIILVKPRDKTSKWLQLECSNKNGIENLVFTRSQGDVGRVKKIPDNDLLRWWETREIPRFYFNERYQNFLSTWKAKAAHKHPKSFINERVQCYLSQLKAMHGEDETIFIPLHAKRINDRDVPSQFKKPENVLKILDEEPRVVLLGDPGSGKSKCLYQKAISLANNWEFNKTWPLLISLYDYSESGLRSLLLKQLPGLYWVDIEADINSGNILLILDGLNECPSKLYEYCHQDIVFLLRDYPTANIIISSRLTHELSIEPRHCKKYDLCPMNHEQQFQFINQYLDSDQSHILINQLNLQPGTEIIAGSPVMLEMAATLMKNRIDFPKSIAKIYKSSLELWHQRETEKNQQNGNVPFWGFNLVCEALSVLAFQMRVVGKVSFSISVARDIISHILGNEAKSFLDRIAPGLLIKVDDKKEFLHFSHETVQEYLAAEYLVLHPQALTKELLEDKLGQRNLNWTMPLVFALEMMKNPPKEFLQNAWVIEPLLVTAALQDSRRLSTLPLYIHEDLWLKGVLRAMRDEDTSLESFEIACISHLPPKYPLPHVLTSTLRGKTFWYSAQTHDEGMVRLERLQNLIFNRDAIWIELLPHVLIAQPTYKANLSSAQQVLVSDKHDIKLENPTISELCILLRCKKISDEIFHAHWEDALLRSHDSQIAMDLLSLIRVNAKLKNKTIDFSKFSSEYKVHLAKIAKNWKLSPRLLIRFVKDGIITIKDIQDDSGRIEDIISRMSPMNAYRFMINEIIKEKDIPAARLKEILEGMEKEDKNLVIELTRKGLLTAKDVVSLRRKKGFSTADLKDAVLRLKIDEELKHKQWDVTVVKLMDHFGFVKHPRFNEYIYFRLDIIKNPHFKTITERDSLNVFIKTKFNNKKSEWGFIVSSGEILKKFSEH